MFPLSCTPMTTKEQQSFINRTLESLKENGITIGFFLKAIDVSRSHWFFLKSGERSLTENKKDQIIEFLKSKLIYEAN